MPWRVALRWDVLGSIGDAPLIQYLHNALNALEVGGILSAHRARWLERGDWVQQLP